MSSVAPSPPEQGQLVCVRSLQWIDNDVRPSTLPALARKLYFAGLTAQESSRFGPSPGPDAVSPAHTSLTNGRRTNQAIAARRPVPREAP